jgi:hypothetical protein
MAVMLQREFQPMQGGMIKSAWQADVKKPDI